MRKPTNRVPGFQRFTSLAIFSHSVFASAYPDSGANGGAENVVGRHHVVLENRRIRRETGRGDTGEMNDGRRLADGGPAAVDRAGSQPHGIDGLTEIIEVRLHEMA